MKITRKHLRNARLFDEGTRAIKIKARKPCYCNRLTVNNGQVLRTGDQVIYHPK